MFDLSTGTSWAKIGGIMSDEHNIVVGDLEIELISIQADINDDDEDILIVVTAITNESPMPQGDLDVYIETNSGSKCYSKEGITSLGPGLQRNWSFEFVLMSGNWSFHLKSNQGKGSMGPFSFDFEYNAQRKRNLKNSIGSSLFSGAFDMSLGDFGQVRERELIDSSNVAMTSYSAENVTGGGTKILVNEESVGEDMMQSTDQVGETNIASDEDQTTEHSNNDVLLTNSLIATPPPSPPAAPPSGPPPTPPPSPPAGPPSGPPPTPPPSPPAGPPSGPPPTPPAGPPSGPPPTPPAGPPSGPPPTPPAGPPSGPPPAGPPSKPPEK